MALLTTFSTNVPFEKDGTARTARRITPGNGSHRIVLESGFTPILPLHHVMAYILYQISAQAVLQHMFMLFFIVDHRCNDANAAMSRVGR